MCQGIPATQRLSNSAANQSSPEPDKVLFAYIAIAPYAVSLMLIRVDNGIQRPVYYVRKSLHEVEVLGSSAWHT